jgi:hypothetical protein
MTDPTPEDVRRLLIESTNESLRALRVDEHVVEHFLEVNHAIPKMCEEVLVAMLAVAASVEYGIQGLIDSGATPESIAHFRALASGLAKQHSPSDGEKQAIDQALLFVAVLNPAEPDNEKDN